MGRLRSAGASVVVVEEDPDVVRRLAGQGVATVRGDGGDPEVLRRAGASRAAAIVSTMRRMDDNARLLATFGHVKILVRVFSGEQARAVRDGGGVPVVEAELAAGAALDWYEDALAPPDSVPGHGGRRAR